MSITTRAPQALSGEVRAGKRGCAEVNCLAVASVLSAGNDRDGCLHLGARCPLWRLSAGFGHWPLLAGVLADERGQDFDHRRVVAGRVAGNAFQRVDAANAHVKLVGAELLDRLGVAVGHMPLLGQLKDCAATG
jgi:hypothetical protein